MVARELGSFATEGLIPRVYWISLLTWESVINQRFWDWKTHATETWNLRLWGEKSTRLWDLMPQAWALMPPAFLKQDAYVRQETQADETGCRCGWSRKPPQCDWIPTLNETRCLRDFEIKVYSAPFTLSLGVCTNLSAACNSQKDRGQFSRLILIGGFMSRQKKSDSVVVSVPDVVSTLSAYEQGLYTAEQAANLMPKLG